MHVRSHDSQEFEQWYTKIYGGFIKIKQSFLQIAKVEEIVRF